MLPWSERLCPTLSTTWNRPSSRKAKASLRADENGGWVRLLLGQIDGTILLPGATLRGWNAHRYRGQNRRQTRRTLVATIERDRDKTAEQGIGLQLAEVKSLIGRLQQIVATAQADEVIARNCLCGQCGEPLPRKGSA